MIVFGGRTSLQAGGTSRRTPHSLGRSRRAPSLKRSDRLQVRAAGIRQRRSAHHQPFNNAALLRSLDLCHLLPTFAPSSSPRDISIPGKIRSRHVASSFSDPKPSQQLFGGSRNAIGETVQVNNFPYVVIGVMKKKGSGFQLRRCDINKLFIPYSAMQRDFPTSRPILRIPSIVYWLRPVPTSSTMPASTRPAVISRPPSQFRSRRQRSCRYLGHARRGQSLSAP